jgi:Uma2 family endonuclease
MTVAEAVGPGSRVLGEGPKDAPEPYTQQEFEALAASYPKLRMELTKEGRLIIMPPAGGESGGRNADLTADLVYWNRQSLTGKVFDSSTGFVLPNGAGRSPDASWVERSRWESLSAEQREKYVPLCPDFVVELLSRTDSLAETREKMGEYLENGVRLGWLINPRRKQVEIYRPGQEVEILDSPVSVSGEPVLPGFTLDLKGILS